MLVVVEKGEQNKTIGEMEWKRRVAMERGRSEVERVKEEGKVVRRGRGGKMRRLRRGPVQ